MEPPHKAQRTAAKSTVQSFQTKILRNAPFFVFPIWNFHTDLHVPFVKDLARTKYNNFNKKLINHPNTILLGVLGGSGLEIYYCDKWSSELKSR